MRTFRIDALVATDEEIREILDSFYYRNKPEVILDARASRVSETAFDVTVRYTGHLELPF